MRAFFILLALYALVACSAQEPEGPAEKIGKGVDQIIGGFNELDGEQSQPGRERYRARQADKNEKSDLNDRQGDDYVPECDPLFDPTCKSDYWRDRGPDDRRY